jgi:hypothetical protein
MSMYYVYGHLYNILFIEVICGRAIFPAYHHYECSIVLCITTLYVCDTSALSCLDLM